MNTRGSICRGGVIGTPHLNNERFVVACVSKRRTKRNVWGGRRPPLSRMPSGGQCPPYKEMIEDCRASDSALAFKNLNYARVRVRQHDLRGFSFPNMASLFLGGAMFQSGNLRQRCDGNVETNAGQLTSVPRTNGAGWTEFPSPHFLADCQIFKINKIIDPHYTD